MSFEVGSLPMPNIPRSRQNLSHGLYTTMSVGRLYPINYEEVLPGDVWSVRALDVSRLTSTFIRPVLDNLFLDVYHFFVPYRLLYDDAERVFGNPNPSAYVDNALAEFPRTYGTVYEKTIADYLGLPPGNYQQGKGFEGVSVLPFRAYALICDKWFRNENTVQEIYVQKGETNSEQLNNGEFSSNNYTGLPMKVNKYKDYFTALVPQPQKGPPVSVGLASQAPVVALAQSAVAGRQTPLEPLRFVMSASGQPPTGTHQLHANGTGFLDGTVLGTVNSSLNGTLELSPANLFADLANASSININDLRLAFQAQKMLERDAAYGSLYNEFIAAHFGEYLRDDRIQFPEYLGGSRTPMNLVQVQQTSASSEESPLGSLAAYSWTNGKSSWRRKFYEHGYIMTVACIRYKHTYQQGVARKWTRFKRDDFYDPLYATVGFQPIYTTELYKQSNYALERENVLGYAPAWRDYRKGINICTGEMRSSASNSLDVYHFADEYTSAPSLTADFTNETPTFVDRTLSVPSTSMDSFIFQFGFEQYVTRRMPVDSMPGWVDHH